MSLERSTQSLHHVTLDVESQDVARVLSNLVHVTGEFDATGLTATADLHLRLDDDRIAHAFRDGNSLVNGVGDVAGRHGDAVAREVPLALILKEIHSLLLSFDYR